MVRRIILLLLIFTMAGLVWGEGNLTLDFSIQNIVMRTRAIEYDDTTGSITGIGDDYWAYGTAGAAGMSFKSSGNRNVKGELSFDFNYPEQAVMGTTVPVITLDRAYVKARFPDFRLTAGKTRMGWGDGFVFNSGDVIFGSVSPYVDLTASEIRTETDWLTGINIPLGRFSFVEALILAPSPDTAGGKLLGAVEDTSLGGRLYTKFGGTKIEAGYMYRGGDTPLHRPYLSFQGNIGPDWYLAASTALPSGASGNELSRAFEDTFNISFGLFHIQELTRVSSMSFRLEGLLMAFSEWEESTSASSGEIPEYALLLYPELAYIPSDSLNISLRSVVSPIDLSAQMTAGISWNVFQGFSLLGYLTANLGEESDTFAFSRKDELWRIGTDSIDGLALTAGVSYIY